ncbi:uncharacterized protein FIBRA_08784 [Fibroporia radiculosa]|uniref:Epoxide hydrolase N-terminal domain-containing protein n=1 Tax=Fibroporia radiculosa TaxID=599839 RepID=J4I3B6_9APHY|nr:uncharacterized protein FIBRA_08784 [Fibroporia radiculosa]CCM06512.1 predicted protein [Fibroporia radiculosa]
MSDTEQSFTLSVPEGDIDLLKKKLELTRFPDELGGAGWDYGVPLADVQRLVVRWKEHFNWRDAEAKINKIPQFMRDIEVEGFGSLNIHYVHQKSEVKNAVPLLFLHGWPGHFLEVQKLLPILTAASPDHPSFHVVAPSLPGYGFSEAPAKPGFCGAQYAKVANKLMIALGYKEYVVQGGDWGSFIARTLAHMYGHKSVKAWHTNFTPIRQPPSLRTHPRLFFQHLFTPYTDAERAGLKRMQWFNEKGRGYFFEQSTQPQTLGYSLADSPAGLLAWIYEKLVVWTDQYPWDDDEGKFPIPHPCWSLIVNLVLTWISIYWFSRAGPTASTRIYYEVTASKEYAKFAWSSIPCGLSFFPQELVAVPRTWARQVGNVVFESGHGSGGHFAAHERPVELAADIRAMFGKGGPAFGVVSERIGYDE